MLLADRNKDSQVGIVLESVLTSHTITQVDLLLVGYTIPSSSAPVHLDPHKMIRSLTESVNDLF